MAMEALPWRMTMTTPPPPTLTRTRLSPSFRIQDHPPPALRTRRSPRLSPTNSSRFFAPAAGPTSGTATTWRTPTSGSTTSSSTSAASPTAPARTTGSSTATWAKTPRSSSASTCSSSSSTTPPSRRRCSRQCTARSCAPTGPSPRRAGSTTSSRRGRPRSPRSSSGVLCRRGRAVPMSRDHKPTCSLERSRIESQGGFVDDGYLNGQLSVARALGDWHLAGLKSGGGGGGDGDDSGDGGGGGPLSAQPEMQQAELTEDDEFLIIGCDGLWDAFSSQDAISFARRRLQQHNDPERCSKDLIVEALKRDTSDNLTVVTVCFRKDPPPSLRIFKPPVRTISNEGLRNLQDLLNSL